MASVIDTAVSWAVAIANDDSHGYSLTVRWGPSYDCSSFVITAYEKAGLPLQKNGAGNTDSMRKAFLKCGFEDVTDKVNFSTGAGLKKGDVLVRIKSKGEKYGHAVLIQADDGTIVEARSSKYGIVANGRYRNGNWTYALRYKDSGSSNQTNWVQKELPTTTNLATKSYESYQAITAKDTVNYQISHSSEAETINGGLRKYRGLFCVAMGSYYGSPGTYVKIVFEDGVTIFFIITDQKKDSETDSRHMYHLHDGSVIEFLVDNTVINCSNVSVGNPQFTRALSTAGINRSAKITQIWTATSMPAEAVNSLAGFFDNNSNGI